MPATSGLYEEQARPLDRADRRRRRYLMEGSFAQAANKHHFKRSRWRRLWRQQIQDWLIAAVQNVALLCGTTAADVMAKRPNSPKSRTGGGIFVTLRANLGLRTADGVLSG